MSATGFNAVKIGRQYLIYPFAVNIREIKCYAQISVFAAAVSPERQKRIERFCFDKDKIRCLTAELLVRYALAERFRTDNQVLNFRCSEYGKPFLENTNIQFNLSHSGEWVVCAVIRSNVGIDVEEVHDLDYRSIYRSFSGNEIAYLESRGQNMCADAFFQLWTLKESYVKYCGLRLKYPFSAFSVIPEYTGGAKVICTDPSNAQAAFVSHKLDDRHWYALCFLQGERSSEIRIITSQSLFDYFRLMY